MPSFLIKKKSEAKQIISKSYWKYFLIAFIDVEANYLIIKAYSLTNVTTIQVIDAFILPITLILSYFILKQSFKKNHIIGVVGCLTGCGLIIAADLTLKTGEEGNHKSQKIFQLKKFRNFKSRSA